jgi:hypothetical protein
MEELQKLYDVLVREGKYSKSFEEFKTKWSSDEAYKDKVYGVVTRDGLYSKDKDSFLQKYSVAQPTPVVKKKDFSELATQPIQEQNTTELPSEDGSLGTQATIQNKSVPTDMSGNPLLPRGNDDFLKNLAQENIKYGKESQKQFAEKQKQFGQEFETNKVKVDKSTNKYLNDRLSTIDPKLINNNEEYVVPQMNYQFGDLGFKFEESGATGDWMIATAPNGKKIEISLDPFMDAKAVSESAKLKQFIKDNTPDKGLYVLDKTYTEERQKVNNQKQVDSSIKKISDDANVLNDELKGFFAKKKALDALPKGSSEYIEMQKNLIAERDSIIKKQEDLNLKQFTLKKSVGKYVSMKGEQGTWLGGTWNAFLEGSSSITAGMVDLVTDIGVELTPNKMMLSPEDLKQSSFGIAKKLGIKPPTEKQTFAEWKSSLTEDQQDAIEDEVDDIAKKNIKKDVIPAIRKGNREVYGSSTTTPEWEQLKSRDFWGGAYLGVVKSLPAMIGGASEAGWAQRTAQFYGQVSDGIKEEMDNNPKFDNVSENEKLAVVLPIGITGAVLEEFGLRNIAGSSPFVNKIAMSAIGKAGVRTTAKTFRELVENEVESKIAKGLITLGAAGLSEAETGSAQQAAEYTVKDIYNAIKGKEMFDTPDSIKEWVTDVAVAGAQEAVGGFMLGVPTAVSAAYSKKGFLNMDDQSFATFEAAANDENIQKAFITDLKTKITQGVITTAQAKETLNNYRNSIGLFKSLPEGLNIQQKKEAMNLLKEKRNLENQIDGKDSALVVKQKERISAIDESLAGISEAANNERVAAENNQREFYALPEEEKSVFVERAKKKIMDFVSDEDVDIDDTVIEYTAYKDFVAQKEAKDRISEIESALAPDAETELSKRERRKLEKELVTLKENQDAIQEQTTNESVLRTEQPGVELQGVGEGNAKPEVITEEQSIIDAKPEEVVSSLKVSDALSEPSGVFVYDGKKGQLTTVGKTLVLETPDEVIDIAYDLDNVSDQSLEDLGVHKEEELDFKLNDDNSIELGSKKYVNNYSNPESAFGKDKDGNYTVTLETENGQKRTFRGQQADRIVYETKLKNFEKNGTEQQIEDAHTAADEAIRIEDQARESAPKREGKSVRKGKQRTLKTVKEPLSKTEIPIEEVKVIETPAIEVTTEVAPNEATAREEVAPVEEAKDLLNLDTKDKGNLQKVFDYLDSLDKALDVNPNELNDVTRIMALGTAKAVIKTLKALVKAGITLQEAINTAAEIHSVDPKDVLKAFDVINQNEKQKSAPSPVRSEIYIGDGRLVSIVKDIKKITMTEKALLVKQIRDKIRGAKDVLKTTKEISQQLAKDVKELVSSGKITATQAANIVSKFSKVNMLNDVSVANFIDYMGKVFADAEYDNKINVAKSKLKDAKKNIATKIGIADGLVGPLQKLFAINPTLIPDTKLEKYLELVDMFGARQTVLTLEEKTKLTNDVIEILDDINNERSLADELAERFNYSDNKVFEEDKLNYADTVKNMLKEGEITEEEAALMTKYKKEIIPQVEKSGLSEEELQKEKNDLLDEIKKSNINSEDLPTRAERDAAKKLVELLKSPAVKELTNVQLKNLLKVIDNINNGYFPHSAHLIIEEINSINNSKVLESSVKRAKLLPLSKIYAKVKSIITRKDAVLEMIRRNPLFNIDQVLGDFKTKDVFNSLLEKAAEAEAKFTSELKAIRSKLSNAEEKIAKSFKLDANKTLMSKFKIMTYMVQLEYKSNQDSKQVNPASEFIKATIKHINEGKSQFGEKDAEMLQQILNDYTDADGNIDTEKLYDSFNGAEKEGIKTIQEINQSLKEKAEYTASVIRGQRINPLSNYIHLNVLSDTKANDLSSGEAFADQYNNSLKPSTKAKSLIERTGKVSPLNFDVFASAEKGAKFILMDYHLTEPIRTARKTINKTISSLGKIDKEKRRIINAISNSFEETVKNLVDNSYIETSIGDDVANYISKQGYRSVLAGTGRFVSEFLSNVGFVIISDPTTFAEGLKHTSVLMSADAPYIMNNVNSKEINRIFPSDTLSGRMIDTNILSEANGIKGGKAKNAIINKAQQIWNLTGKKYKNAVELTADVLISTPDKAIMRPIWFGTFATNFKNETGKDVDFKKIAANDEAYMNENRDAIEKAKDAADERSVITGASNNAFTGILKGTSKPNQSNTIKGFNNFNNFMTRFLIYEYTSARTGIMAAIGNGSLNKRQGIALLGAVTTRMTVYSLLSKALGSGLIGLLFGDDDDEKEKSLKKSIGQALTSSFTSMIFNRDFGNATKTIINQGIEKVNENYLQVLREGKYDQYKDAIQYSAVPIEKQGKQTGLYDYIENMSGSFGPAIKTTNLIVKTYSEKDKKKPDAIQRQEDVKNIRIPLEVLGNAGFIPLYKDIRKEVMKEIYKVLDKSKPNLRTVKEGEEFK